MLKLTDWIPTLAREIYGKKYNPTMDMIVHIDAQRAAGQMDIPWGLEMLASDVEEIKTVVLNKRRK